MRKAILAVGFAVAAAPAFFASVATAQYAPWPPPPGMSAQEYAARYGDRVRPGDQGDPRFDPRAQPRWERGGGYREERDFGYRERGRGYGQDRDYEYGERGRGSRSREYAFDEREYLRCNPDVRAAIVRGQIQSGAAHYQTFGMREGRRLSCR